MVPISSAALHMGSITSFSSCISGANPTMSGSFCRILVRVRRNLGYCMASWYAMVGKTRNGLLQLASSRETKKLAPSHPRSVSFLHTVRAIADLPLWGRPWSMKIHGTSFVIQLSMCSRMSTCVRPKSSCCVLASKRAFFARGRLRIGSREFAIPVVMSP